MDSIQAEDAALGLFWTAWQAKTTAIAGSVPKVEWENIDDHVFPSIQAPWAAVKFAHTSSAMTSLGGQGARTVRSQVTVSIRIYVPIAQGGRLVAMQLANVAADSLLGQSVSGGDLVFSSSAPRELGPMNAYYAVDVIAQGTYTRTI